MANGTIKIPTLIIDVPISDILADTSKIVLTSAKTWAKKVGNILYLSIILNETTSTGWVTISTFKPPYTPQCIEDYPAIGNTGGGDGIFGIAGSTTKTLSAYTKILDNGKNRLYGMMTLLI